MKQTISSIALSAVVMALPMKARVQAENLTIVDASDARVKDPDKYFSKEYLRINDRRKTFGFARSQGSLRPPKIVGLAFSGGGMRSNAFQMGLLSGLYSEGYSEGPEPAKLLDRVDYISSVSGGSWANSALWAWQGGLQKLFKCLDSAATSSKREAVRRDASCADAVTMLRETQVIHPFSQPDHQRKEEWERDIVDAHLRTGCSGSFAVELPPNCAENFQTKPYPIINSTHSAASEELDVEEKVDGFPFETTPDHAGTVVDVGSKRPKVPSSGESGPKGFFIDFPSPNVSPKVGWMRCKFSLAQWLRKECELVDGSSLSMATAHSSGVLMDKGPNVTQAMTLNYDYQIVSDGKPIVDHSLKSEYKLNDGGKSDNSAGFALVDRNVDVLVMSYMGKEKRPFTNFDTLQSKALETLGCKMVDKLDKTTEHKRSQKSSFSCSPDESKPTLHVHPWPSNIDDFIEDLKASAVGDGGAKSALHHIENVQSLLKVAGETRPGKKLATKFAFPQTDTFLAKYPEDLILAYYLLGKFVAKRDIAPFLREQLATH